MYLIFAEGFPDPEDLPRYIYTLNSNTDTRFE